MSNRLQIALSQINNLQRKLSGVSPTANALLIKSKLTLATQLLKEAEALEADLSRELVSASVPAAEIAVPPALPKHWVRPFPDNTPRLRDFPLPADLPTTPVVEEALSYQLHASASAIHSLAASQQLPVLFHQLDEEQTQILLIDQLFINEKGQPTDVWGLDMVTLGRHKTKDEETRARRCWPQVLLFPEVTSEFLVIHFYKIEPSDCEKLSAAIEMRKMARKLSLVPVKKPEIIKA